MPIQNRNGALFLATGIDNSGLFSGLNQAENRVDQFEAHIKRVGLTVGAAFGIDSFANFTKQVVNLRGEIQQLEIAFETMLGSKERSDAMMADIKRLALSTPFTLTEVADNTKQLIAMGIATDKAIETVKSLGDVAAGVSVPLSRIAINYGQVSALGKLQSREIRDFAMAGIPIVEELSKMLGKTSAEVYELVEAGKVGFPQVEQAFKNMSGEGGKFYNLMEKQNASVTGQLSKLQDELQLAFNSIGKNNERIIYGSINLASELVANYERIGEALAILIATYGTAKAAMMFNTAIENTVSSVKLIEESKSLESLITVEQKAVISKQNLIKGTTEYAVAVKSAALANVEAAKQQVSALGQEASAQNAAMIAAKQKVVAAGELVVQRKAELADIIGIAEADKVASLQKKMAVESERQSRAALLSVKLQEQKNNAIYQAQALKEANATEQKIIAKNREIAAIHNKIVAAKAEEIQYSRNVSAIRSEIKSVSGNIASKQIETAQKRLDTAVTKENTAVTERNIAMKTFYSQKAKIQAASQTAATLATRADTAASSANVTATNLLSTAKTRLTIIATKLNTVLAANKLTIIAAAAVALGYGIYKLATYQTEAEKATSRLNDTTKEYESSIEGEKIKLDILFGRLKSAKEGTDKYKEAKQGILNIADQYHLSISKDIDLVKEETKYRNILNAAIIETAKSKAIESGTQKATDIYTQQWGNGISDIRNRFIKKFGESQGELLLDSLKESLSGGSELTKEVQGAINRFSEVYYGSSATGGGSTTLNPVQQIVNNIQNSKKVLDKEVNDLESVFGKIRKTASEEDKKTAKSGADQIYDATKKVKDLKRELNDLNNKIIPEDQKENPGFKFSKAIEDKLKELKDAENEFNLLLYGKSTKEIGKEGKAGETAAEKARKQAQDIADKELKIKNDAIKAEQDATNARLENRQAEINMLEDSFAKEQTQLDLNHDKELLAIEKRTQELIEKEQERRRAQWNIDNPKGTKTPYITDVNSIFDLNISDRGQIASDRDVANRANLKATKDLLKSMLAEYQDYYTQREEINKKYDSDLVALESLPASEENERAIAELKKRWQEALSSINLQEFQDQIDWSIIFGNLDKVSTDELVKLRNKLKQYLETVGKSLSPQDLKTVTDAFENLNEKIADKRPIQELKDGYLEYRSAIEEVIAAKKELAKYEEGTDGYVKATEALTAAEKKRADSLTKMSQSINKIGSVGSEMVNSGQELVDMLTNLGIEIPEAVSKALDGIGQVMGGLEKINLTNPASIISGAVSVISGIGNTIAGVFGFGNKDKKKEKEIQRLQSQVEILEKSYEKLGRAIEKAYSYNASGLINEQNEALEQQKLLIQQQIKKEEDKKKTDKDRVREWKEQLEQIDLLIEENKEKAIDAIFGQDIQSAIDDFANAYVDAWAAGEDRAKAMKDVVKKMIKGVVVEMLKSDLAPTVAKIRDKIQEYLTDGIIDATEQAELDRIIEQATKDADNKYGWADKYINENEDTRSSTAKGIATASQDSVDYLSGLWALSVEFSRSTNENVILIHTMTRDIVTSINELKQNSSSILMHVQNIDNNTESIRQDISGMREDINHMRIHGTQLAK